MHKCFRGVVYCDVTLCTCSMEQPHEILFGWATIEQQALELQDFLIQPLHFKLSKSIFFLTRLTSP